MSAGVSISMDSAFPNGSYTDNMLISKKYADSVYASGQNFDVIYNNATTGGFSARKVQSGVNSSFFLGLSNVSNADDNQKNMYILAD